MLERLNFLVVYVGSAAMVAFLAASLSWPQVSTYTCHASGPNGVQRCELAATLDAGVPEIGATTPEIRNADARARKSATAAESGAEAILSR